jgi:hypothetical protein
MNDSVTQEPCGRLALLNDQAWMSVDYACNRKRMNFNVEISRPIINMYARNDFSILYHMYALAPHYVCHEK